ncbi:MAG: AAA family ATPase, partial [Candidatus Woesearchaeota archaeon]
MVRFINRKIELNVLEKDYIKRNNAFVVLYGRRRIGKTRLIQEFLKNKEGIRFTASDTNNVIQIRELKNHFATFLNDEYLKDQEILDWRSFFIYIKKTFPKDKKCYIWIDEFSYLIKNDSSLTSIFQEFIDNFLRDSNIFFIVSGSMFGLMTEKVLSHSSPLYGRRTRDILLTRLQFKYLKEFVNFSFEDILKLEFTIGGIAEYLLISKNYNKYDDFIKNEFLLKEGYFFREIFFLLSQEFKEIKTYFSIINAIAYGKTKPSDIANFIGVSSREIYPYLELLINYGFVKRETSMLGNKKSGLYYIDDNFLDFWFNFVNKNRENIEKNNFKINKSELNAYFGKRFEIFI